MPQLILLSESPVKVQAANKIIKMLKSILNIDYYLLTERTTEDNGQLFENNIIINAKLTIENFLKKSELDNTLLGQDDIIISMVNGLFLEGEHSKIFGRDVCIVGIHMNNETRYYVSKTITIKNIFFEQYCEYYKKSTEYKNNILWTEKTFGEYVEKKIDYLNVDKLNWMKEDMFGNIDRLDQIMSAVNNFYINIVKDHYNIAEKEFFNKINETPELKHNLKINFNDCLQHIFYITKSTKLDCFVTDFEKCDISWILCKYSHIPVYDISRANELFDKNIIVYYPYLDADDEKYSDNINVLASYNNIMASICILDSPTNFDFKFGSFISDDQVKEFCISDSLRLSKFATREYITINESFKPTKRRFTHKKNYWNNLREVSNNLNELKIVYMDRDRGYASRIFQVIKNSNKAAKNFKFDDYCIRVKDNIFPNGESNIVIDQNIRGCHAVIIARIYDQAIDNTLMKLWLLLDTLNRSGVNKKTLIIPYYPYSRADKKENRTHIGGAMVSNIFTMMGIDNIISLDLHAGQIQGFIKKGFHNLYFRAYICEYLDYYYLSKNNKENNEKYILIAPDAGSTKAIKKYSDMLKISNIAMDKTRNYTSAANGESAVDQVRYIGSKKDFRGKTGIIIDDIGDTMGTMTGVCDILIKDGLKDCIIVLTHGIFSGPAIERINDNNNIKAVIVSDSYDQTENIKICNKIKVISSAEIFGRTIDGVFTGKSISCLF